MALIVISLIAVAGLATALWLWRERRRLRRRLAEAEAYRLRSQLNPHFLGNALDAIAALGFSDSKTAAAVVGALRQLMRQSLDVSQYREIALHQEQALLERYLAIEKMLLGERLHYRLAFDPDVLNAQVPSMILQPLAENALTHGIGSDGVARVTIKAMRGGDRLIIAVSDRGPGLRSGLEPGFGLANTRARLAQLYGGKAQLKLLEPPDGGLMAQLMLPFHDG